MAGPLRHGRLRYDTVRSGMLRLGMVKFGVALQKVALKDSLEFIGVRFPCYLQNNSEYTKYKTMKDAINNSDSGNSLVDEIIETFVPGDLISHQWFKNKFHIKDKKELKFKDYGNEEAYLEAIDKLEKQYRAHIDHIADQLLEGGKGWLINRPGEGYMILPYDEHVTRAYKRFVDRLEKSMLKTNRLLVFRPPVTAEQRVKDNNRIARYSWFIQMVPELNK